VGERRFTDGRLSVEGVRRSPREHRLALPDGTFRAIEWAGAAGVRPVVLLHGLTAVAGVWAAMVEAMGDLRPTFWALDQRGHGDSHPERGGWGISAYVGDAAAFIDAAGLGRPHVVGHSMGARVAMVLAARRPAAVHSVAIVDIGPEQWKANWQGSVAAFDAMPDRFTDEAEAMRYAGTRTSGSPVGTGAFLARLRPDASGGLTWRADRNALKATVRSHRSRNYWRDWEALDRPALFVRGGTSHEVRPAIAAEMARRNPRVESCELEGVGHNIPLIAPEKLASVLSDFWGRHA
jgi:2-(acetamidomethylene)succinate hydrolase